MQKFILKIVTYLTYLAYALFMQNTYAAYTMHTVFDSTIFGKVKIYADSNLTAKHTFIFFINGDTYDYAEDRHGEYSQASSYNFKNIIRLVQKSKINAVIVVDRMGERSRGIFGYNIDKSSALLIYRQGELLFRRGYADFNMASQRLYHDTFFIAGLFFQETNMHIIYRGHGFFPITTNFDSTNSNTPFSIIYFVEAAKQFLKTSSIQTFSSITFAACKMGYFKVAFALAPYFDYMISSQIPILQKEKIGFSFDFLRQISDKTSVEGAVSKIANTLLKELPWRPNRDSVSENVATTPLQLIDLHPIRAAASFTQWTKLVEPFREKSSFPISQATYNSCVVFADLSSTFTSYMTEQGRTEELTDTRQYLWQAMTFEHQFNPNKSIEVDLSCYLQHEGQYSIPTQYRKIQQIISRSVLIDNYNSTPQRLHGMSIIIKHPHFTTEHLTQIVNHSSIQRTTNNISYFDDYIRAVKFLTEVQKKRICFLNKPKDLYNVFCPDTSPAVTQVASFIKKANAQRALLDLILQGRTCFIAKKVFVLGKDRFRVKCISQE